MRFVDVRKGPLPMMTLHDRSRRKSRPRLLLLLLLPFALTLWPGLYNTTQPELIGIPFFYWFQMFCILLTAVLMAILYYVENLKRDASKGLFSGQQDDLFYHLGFYFGMVHGSILDPRSGQLRPDVTALVTFTHPNAKRGYSVARRDHFYYADITYIRTESALLKELSEIALDLMSHSDEPDSWYYAIGCLVGGLSIPLFPETDQEWQQWEAEHRALQAQMRRDMTRVRETEPLPAHPTLQEA
jgi:hypothetical protein